MSIPWGFLALLNSGSPWNATSEWKKMTYTVICCRYNDTTRHVVCSNSTWRPLTAWTVWWHVEIDGTLSQKWRARGHRDHLVMSKQCKVRSESQEVASKLCSLGSNLYPGINGHPGVSQVSRGINTLVRRPSEVSSSSSHVVWSSCGFLADTRLHCLLSYSVAPVWAAPWLAAQ